MPSPVDSTTGSAPRRSVSIYYSDTHGVLASRWTESEEVRPAGDESMKSASAVPFEPARMAAEVFSF